MNTYLHTKKINNKDENLLKKILNNLIMIGGAISITYFSIPKDFNKKVEEKFFYEQPQIINYYELNEPSNVSSIYEIDKQQSNKIVSEFENLNNTDSLDSKTISNKIDVKYIVYENKQSLEKNISNNYPKYSTNFYDFRKNYSSFLENVDSYYSYKIYEISKQRENSISKHKEWVEQKLQFLGRFLEEIYFTSKRYEVPLYVSLGIFLIENDGKLNSYNSLTDDAGIYQFQRSTAKGLGLIVNSEIDERFHPEKSIDAAIRYMKLLYNQFGRWDLAMLAYNQGSGRVRALVKEYIKINYKQDLSTNSINSSIIKNYNIHLYKLTNSEHLKRKFSGFNKIGQYYVYNAIAWNEIFLKKMNEINYEFFEIMHLRYDSYKSWNEISKKYKVNVELLKKENPHIKNAYGIPKGVDVRIPLRKEIKNLFKSYTQVNKTKKL
ncbi:MAG: transglycosylase SLT domain-containing protein [Candidatus Woesearchaeota archaeon]